jgi:hypothetical protein
VEIKIERVSIFKKGARRGEPEKEMKMLCVHF